jgi:hypothetical protein
MTYKAKVAVCSEIHTNTERKASTMENFLMSNQVVRKESLGFKWLKKEFHIF